MQTAEIYNRQKEQHTIMETTVTNFCCLSYLNIRPCRKGKYCNALIFLMEKILSLQATKFCRYKQLERKFCHSQ